MTYLSGRYCEMPVATCTRMLMAGGSSVAGYMNNMHGITLLVIHQSDKVPTLCREMGSETVRDRSLSHTYTYIMYDVALLTDLYNLSPTLTL